MHAPDSEKYLYVLSIDIGIINLAFVLLECNKNYTIHDIVYFELFDITTFPHLDKHSKKTCTIKHTKTIADWLEHIFYLNTELFDLCTHILIERQPPQGHVAVEQLFYYKFREKAVLVHPRSVHSYFRWNSTINYEKRKEKSVEIMQYRLAKTKRSWLVQQFEQMDRQHDISDAYIQAVYFLTVCNK